MAKLPMSEEDFYILLNTISQETGSKEMKLDILYKSKGCFSAEQAAYILELISIQGHKVRAIRIMEPRLCRMTCDEARMIIATVTNQNDKVSILHTLKRVLADHQSNLGEEYILSGYPFETDKFKSWNILQTVRSDVARQISAGGHQGYAALGGLYTQARPLLPHMYGTLQEQYREIPGQGDVEIPPAALPTIVPSLYSSHPSYAYTPPINVATAPYAHLNDPSFPGTLPTGQPRDCRDSAAVPPGFAVQAYKCD